MELTTEQKQEWEKWLSERPENVRKVAEKPMLAICFYYEKRNLLFR